MVESKCRTAAEPSGRVHKDFHGTLSFMVSYLRQKFSAEVLRDFLRRACVSVYMPLIKSVNARGLSSLEEYLCSVFQGEGANFEIRMIGEELVLEVRSCPAISHMRRAGYAVDPEFCQMSTGEVMRTIASSAGLEFSLVHDQLKGSCTQRFRLGGEHDTIG